MCPTPLKYFICCRPNFSSVGAVGFCVSSNPLRLVEGDTRDCQTKVEPFFRGWNNTGPSGGRGFSPTEKNFTPAPPHIPVYTVAYKLDAPTLWDKTLTQCFYLFLWFSKPTVQWHILPDSLIAVKPMTVLL